MKNLTNYFNTPIPRIITNKLLTHNNKLRYPKLGNFNGEHSLKKWAPDSIVEYAVRTRHGGTLSYFNFDLAQQMGLIDDDHPHQLNQALEQEVLDTFSIVIINEYDLAHNISFSAHEIKPNKYMATRYLQAQHPDKRGLTSGDGRGIWNGESTHNGITWDIISSGTGATRLSPAVAREKKFFQTGDPKVCYGCGYNDFDSGLSAALMSEVFYKNGIATERTLALITFKDGTSINVRAGQNLIRPSHFFGHMKQGNYQPLKNMVDYFIDRQVKNRKWPLITNDKEKYRYFGQQLAEVFAKTAANFESNYIFVWLDWDGDNILADGGIIDYGSVRQFGLFHHQYRYDDVERFSTTIAEQKKKAQYIVQTFAQIVSFLNTGRKKPITQFKTDSYSQLFQKNFNERLQENFLHQIGFSARERQLLLQQNKPILKKFYTVFRYFERKQSSRGIYKTHDGITADAIFCMRDIMREWPQYYLKNNQFMSPEWFMNVIKSSYARKNDLRLSPTKIKRINEFQQAYYDLLTCLKGDANTILLQVCMRSSIINRYDRITGSSIIYVTDYLIANHKKISRAEFHKIFNRFVAGQNFMPSAKLARPQKKHSRRLSPKGARILKQVNELVQRFRECI